MHWSVCTWKKKVIGSIICNRTQRGTDAWSLVTGLCCGCSVMLSSPWRLTCHLDPCCCHRVTWHSLSPHDFGITPTSFPSVATRLHVPHPQLQHCAWDQSDCRGGAVCTGTKRLRGWTALECKVGATHTRSEGKYRGNLNKQHNESFQRG